MYTYLHKEESLISGCLDHSDSVLYRSGHWLFTEHWLSRLKHHQHRLQVLDMKISYVHNIYLWY